MGMLVSVVIPAYNEEKYISECIDSVINQTYSNLEIIIIDDGSKDNTGTICDRYAIDDSRINVIHKENEGLVAARKSGINAAKSDYIVFVDSDDYIDKTFVESMMEIRGKYDCDVIAGSFVKQFGEKKSIVKNEFEEGFYDYSSMKNTVYPHMLSNGVFFRTGIKASLCAKLLRRDVLTKVYEDMPDGIRNGEDAAIVYPYLLCSTSMYVMNEALYYYRQFAETMSQRKNTKADELSNKLLFTRLKAFFERYPDKYELKRQLSEFMAQFLLQHDCAYFDKSLGQLRCFGKIAFDAKIAVYGAGRFGKQVYFYAKQCGRNPIWIDQNYLYYQEQGLPVDNKTKMFGDDIDNILIAVIDHNIACEIKNNLINEGIDEDRMNLLDIEYISSRFA